MPAITTAESLKVFAERNVKEVGAFREKFRLPGQHFSAPTEAEIIRKLLAPVALPQIIAQGWTSGTGAGAKATYSVYISNPGPDSYFPMFVTIFFGLANFGANIIEGFGARDTSWPYRTTESFNLAAGTTVTKDFEYVVPAGTEGNTYTGNSVVWVGNWHDTGRYCDRGMFDIRIT